MSGMKQHAAEYELRCIRGEHYEVYKDGKFIFSADTKSEALQMIREEQAA